ncbi:MAG: hypothetical protein L6V93_15650 [Clostridiales bacterium]|nr:MAG: hypothetical protein L6V93_15650 [Clostridiales bacterium]
MLTKNTLIPRPDTETVVEEVIARTKKRAINFSIYARGAVRLEFRARNTPRHGALYALTNLKKPLRPPRKTPVSTAFRTSASLYGSTFWKNLSDLKKSIRKI